MYAERAREHWFLATMESLAHWISLPSFFFLIFLLLLIPFFCHMRFCISRYPAPAGTPICASSAWYVCTHCSFVDAREIVRTHLLSYLSFGDRRNGERYIFSIFHLCAEHNNFIYRDIVFYLNKSLLGAFYIYISFFDSLFALVCFSTISSRLSIAALI